MLDGGFSNAVDGTFKEVKDDNLTHRGMSDKKPSTMLATLETFQLPRHPLMQDKVTPEIEKIQTELEIDKELGLQQQMENTANKALKADIDELTKSNDYFQVSKGLLERLFRIQQLQFDCWGANIESFFKSLYPACMTATILTVSTLALLPILIMTSIRFWGHPSATAFGVCAAIGVGVGWVISSITGGFAIQQWAKVKIAWDTISVKLDSVVLSEVKEKIPLGAKMKVLEAKRSGIFEDFVYVHPQFTIGRQEIEVHKYIPKINIDPAILGVTKDKRMFMVVYWDTKKDVEHIIKQISDFKKFKVAE